MPEPDQTLPFAAILNALDRGRTATELSRRMQDLIGEVRRTGKAGKLTIALTVKPSKVDGMVDIEETLAVKVPEFDRRDSSFFVTDDNNLTQTDPRQTELDFGPRALNRETR